MQSKFIKGTPDEMQQSDHARFFNSDPADGFSAEHNAYIVEKTIEEYEKKRAENLKVAVNHYEERADAVITYLRALDRGNAGNSNLEKYFGKKTLAYLRGQQIRDQLMSGLTVKNKKGVIIKPGGV